MFLWPRRSSCLKSCDSGAREKAPAARNEVLTNKICIKGRGIRVRALRLRGELFCSRSRGVYFHQLRSERTGRSRTTSTRSSRQNHPAERVANCAKDRRAANLVVARLAVDQGRRQVFAIPLATLHF